MFEQQKDPAGSQKSILPLNAPAGSHPKEQGAGALQVIQTLMT